MALAGYVLMLFTLQVGTHNSKESEKILDQLTNLMGLSLGHVKFHENRLTIFRVILLTYRHTKTTNQQSDTHWQNNKTLDQFH